MRTKEEILKIFKDNGISGYQLGKDIDGITYVAANKFLNGETKNPYKSTLKLYNSYIDNDFQPLSKQIKLSDLYPDYVPTNENHYTNEESKPLDKPEIIANNNGNKFIELPNGKYRIQVPKIPHTAYASFIEVFDDEYQLHEDFEETYFTVDKIGRGKYISFTTGNDSMNGGSLYDTPGGAEVLGREVGRHLWQDGFHKSDYGFIIVAQNGIFHKDIENTDRQGVVNCLSRNPSPEFQPFELILDEVHSIWKIIKRTF